MPVIPHKAKTTVASVSSAAPSFDSLLNMSNAEFSAMGTKERQPWKNQKPKLNRGRPNSVLRARRKLQGDFDTIDQDEAAAILGKSTKTLQRYRNLKYGPSFKIESGYVSYSQG